VEPRKTFSGVKNIAKQTCNVGAPTSKGGIIGTCVKNMKAAKDSIAQETGVDEESWQWEALDEAILNEAADEAWLAATTFMACINLGRDPSSIGQEILGWWEKVGANLPTGPGTTEENDSEDEDSEWEELPQTKQQGEELQQALVQNQRNMDLMQEAAALHKDLSQLPKPDFAANLVDLADGAKLSLKVFIRPYSLTGLIRPCKALRSLVTYEAL
jgi:hypothetical protein